MHNNENYLVFDHSMYNNFMMSFIATILSTLKQTTKIIWLSNLLSFHP
jgi:hypothetical protein